MCVSMSMFSGGAGTLIRAPGSQFCVCLISVNQRLSLNIYCGSTDSLDPSHYLGPSAFPPKQPFREDSQRHRKSGVKGVRARRGVCRVAWRYEGLCQGLG